MDYYIKSCNFEQNHHAFLKYTPLLIPLIAIDFFSIAICLNPDTGFVTIQVYVKNYTLMYDTLMYIFVFL